MKLSRLFGLFKRKRWMDFEEAQRRALQRLRLRSNEDDCKESTKNSIDNNSDMFGVYKR